MIYIGIDPGKSGGIAVMDTILSFTQVSKMPETEKDIWEFFRMLKERHQGGLYAVIEDVHAMPGQGVTSMFTFGSGLGGLRMALIGNGISFEKVSPMKWQKFMGCLSKGDKNVTKRKAQELFPNHTITHAVADALLIAEYARRNGLGE